MKSPLEMLVDQLDVPLSPAVRHAFLSVDRKQFVPSYYRRDGKAWKEEETGETAYKDMPLVTKMELGRPVSSSSMPSVMAAMLEALALRTGQNVLEIGAGTGYNAALLSHIVGPSGQVISVECDHELGACAAQRLREADGKNVQVVITDGVLGCPSYAPYQRIIATAAFRQFPPAWSDQLASGGIFVGNYLGNLTSILIRLHKQEDGTLTGAPVPHGAFFMELRSPQITVSSPIDWTIYESRVIDGDAQEQVMLPTLLKQQAFLLFLQERHPHLQMHKRYIGGPPEQPSSFETWLIDTKVHTSITLKADRIEFRGKNLWESIQQSMSRWKIFDPSPTLETYRLTVSSHGKIEIDIPFDA